ncbi:MAG: hypothetical protein FWG25_06655 [Promicromonosporaceae bacterium]|nr:hypothetical protein [Promicromonosporaceae bacterium]
METEAGDQFVGEPLGSLEDVTGPLVVCTAALSPLAELRKPEYDGAIVVFTTPHIGGVASDLGGAVAAGVVIREPALDEVERGRVSVSELLDAAGISGIAGVDTRQITQLVAAAGGSLPAEIKRNCRSLYYANSG